MATSGELVEIVSKALGVASESVAQHLRNLREDGLISRKGYGRGAASMSPLDAARLILAVTGSAFVKDSVETLQSFGALRRNASMRLRPGSDEIRPGGGTLEEYFANALQSIIDWNSKGRLPAAYTNDRLYSRVPGLQLLSALTQRTPPYPKAAFASWFGHTGADVMTFATKGWPNRIKNPEEFFQSMGMPAMVQVRQVSRTALARIALTL